MRELDFHRDAHPVLDGVFGYLPGIGGGAAGDHDDLVDRLEIVLVDAHLVKLDGTRIVETPQQRALHGRRILVDLLVHERIPAALFGRGGIPVDGEGLGVGHHIAVEIGDRHLVRAHAHGLVLVDFHRALGIGDERGHVGAEEVLALAQAHHQRRIVARADDDARLAAVGGQDRERALKHAGQAAHRLEQIGRAVFGDDLVDDFAQQFGRHFRVGGRGETIAFRHQIEPQLRGVFDDAVVDDGHFAVLAGVRMGVDVARLAVGGPAGVPDAHGGGGHRIALDVFDEVLQAAGLLAHRHLLHAGGAQRHAGRIIAAVFEALQALQAHFQRFAAHRIDLPCVSNDSTHSSPH